MAALDLLGRRWALRILWELRDGDRGFRELQAMCDGMSPSVLRDRLGELGDSRLVHQRMDDRYELSRTGRQLIDAIQPLSKWADRWARQLEP